MSATSDKEKALEALRQLPENATLEEAIERLSFLAKVDEGLRQSEAGQMVPHEETGKTPDS